MKRTTILAGGAMVFCLALGVFALVIIHRRALASASTESPESNSTTVSVQVGKLKRVTLHGYIAGYGTVEGAPATAKEPAAEAPLAPPTAGVVISVEVLAGQHVGQGTVLMEMNSGTATFANAKAEVERQKQLFAQHNTSLQALQSAETQLDLLRLVSPLSGTITRLSVQPGSAVDVNTVVAEVMDLNRLAVTTKIPATRAVGLKVGEEVQVLGEPPVTATLSFVSPVVSAKDGTVSSWAALPAGSGLRPGAFLPLRIVTSIRTNCLAAPAESVVTDERGQSVISLVREDEATQIPVRTGLRENGWVELSAPGLEKRDTVVTVGAYRLPAKTKIQVVNASRDESSSAGTNGAPEP